MKKIMMIVFLLIMLLFPGCQKKSDLIVPDNPEKTEDTEDTSSKSEEQVKPLSKAEQILSEMTTEEKVAQLFFIRVDCLDETILKQQLIDPYAKGVTTVSDEMRSFYDRYPVGGFCLFTKNIINPEQLSAFTEQLHGLNEIIPLIATDEEGGGVTRIACNRNFDVPRFSSMSYIATSKDSEKAFEVGQSIGSYLKDYGVDIDLAPVADVNTNPKNPVIGRRAFGSDAAIAAQMVTATVLGFHESDTFCCLKHFPGHGDTSEDSHYGVATLNKTWDEMKDCELLPFIAGINAGADFVMIGHIACPAVTGDSTPATLSYTLVTEKLRGELGYDGVICTDDLSMGATANLSSPDDICVRAILAGCDALMLSSDFKESYDGVLSAVNSGVIQESRIDESVRRILELKYGKS